MKLEKYKNNPILSPNERNDWESLCVLNPGVYYDNGVFYMLYRAAGHDETHYIRLGLATSTDGYNFTRASDKPVLEPDYNGLDGGIEDPRIIKIGDYFYVTYAARAYPTGQYWRPDCKPPYTSPLGGPRFTTVNNTLSYLAITRDFKTFKKLGRITDSRTENRDVLLFPEKVNGKYALITRPMDYVGPKFGCEAPSIWISFSDDMMEFHKHKLLMKGEQWWETKKIGGSCPPIKTEFGWFFLYHGVSARDDGYRVGAVLLDLKNPAKVIARTKDFIMEPEHDYETKGFYNGCVFPTGNVVVDGKLFVYYGAADHYCCVATCDFSELLNHLKKDKR